MAMTGKFEVGQKVRVVTDYEDPEPESPWVGAIGKVIRIKNWYYVVNISEGNPNPDDGNDAWFTEDELEEVVD